MELFTATGKIKKFLLQLEMFDTCTTGDSAHIVTIRYIYLTAIGLTPFGSSTVHIYTEYVEGNTHNKQILNIHNNKKLTNLGSAGRAPSLRVIPWHLPYN
jgi:hypothetical protein